MNTPDQRIAERAEAKIATMHSAAIDCDRERKLEARVKELEEQLAEAKDAADYWEGRDAERQKSIGMQEYRGNTISYIYDKEKNYGMQFDDLRAQLAAKETEAPKGETPDYKGHLENIIACYIDDDAGAVNEGIRNAQADLAKERA